METKDDLTGRFARLPNGQKVRIESVEWEVALVMRLGGLRRGTFAVCPLARLKMLRQPILCPKTVESAHKVPRCPAF